MCNLCQDSLKTDEPALMPSLILCPVSNQTRQQTSNRVNHISTRAQSQTSTCFRYILMPIFNNIDEHTKNKTHFHKSEHCISWKDAWILTSGGEAGRQVWVGSRRWPRRVDVGRCEGRGVPSWNSTVQAQRGCHVGCMISFQLLCLTAKSQATGPRV